MAGFEPATSSLPRKCSTPELHGQFWSGRRGSNSRPLAWKANALPTELLPHSCLSAALPKELWAKMDSNHRRHKPADLQSAPFGHSGIHPRLLRGTSSFPFAVQSYKQFPIPANFSAVLLTLKSNKYLYILQIRHLRQCCKEIQGQGPLHFPIQWWCGSIRTG